MASGQLGGAQIDALARILEHPEVKKRMVIVALHHPELFGNVISQSGAFWRGAEASNNAPYEWLTQRVVAMPKRDVRFAMDVGADEDHATLGGAGPNFLEANRRFRDALTAKGYTVAYREIAAGQHGPQYWMQALPGEIVSLSAVHGTPNQ